MSMWFGLEKDVDRIGGMDRSIGDGDGKIWRSRLMVLELKK